MSHWKPEFAPMMALWAATSTGCPQGGDPNGDTAPTDSSGELPGSAATGSTDGGESTDDPEATGEPPGTGTTGEPPGEPGFCGDGVVDPGEACDDGDDDADDACTPACEGQRVEAMTTGFEFSCTALTGLFIQAGIDARTGKVTGAAISRSWT